MSSGSYKKFTNWLETLATEQPQLPKGFLFFAFDNEQKGQKNYLDRGFNTVVFHTVTIKTMTDPWLYSEPPKKQYEELFQV